MKQTASLMTAQQLMELPDDAMQYELVLGELLMSPPAGRDHGRFETRIVARLDAHVTRHELGEVTTGDTGFLLSRNPDTVRAPDAGFISNGRIRLTDPREHYWTVAPDLAVEVLSPGDRPQATAEKVAQYLDAGVLLVWVVNTKTRTIRQYAPGTAVITLTISDTLDGGSVVPGFRMPVREVFNGRDASAS